ncbi:MAG: hypothetical protein V7K24_29220 [Nostoc sp.]
MSFVICHWAWGMGHWALVIGEQLLPITHSLFPIFQFKINNSSMCT